MEKLLLTLAFAVLCTAVAGQACTGYYAAERSSDGVDWSVEWNVTADLQYVTFTVTASTDDWVAIGFSLDQMMPNTDVVVGSSNGDGSQSYVSDRYATSRNAPEVDLSQNITNAEAQEVAMNGNTYTIFTFTRAISSDDTDDLSLNQNVYFLYAWGMEVNFDGNDANSIMGHRNTDRGASGYPISVTTCLVLIPTDAPTDAPTNPPNPSAPVCSGEYTAAATSNTIDWNVQWTVFDAQYINFTVMARTVGWVAIGFSLDQMMANSDIVVGAANADGSQSYVSDRNVGAVRAAPTVDSSQDIMNAEAREMVVDANTYTIVTFTRAVSSGDTVQDIALDQEVYLLYAWGVEVNFDPNDAGSISQHAPGAANRGPSTMLIDFSCPVNLPVTSPSPTPTEGAATVPVATAMVLILALIALMATLF